MKAELFQMGGGKSLNVNVPLKVWTCLATFAATCFFVSAEIAVNINCNDNITWKADNSSDLITLKVKDSQNPKSSFFVWDGLPAGAKFVDELRSEVQISNPSANINATCWSIPTSVYEPLKSIETTGSNWIDTGIHATDSMVIRAEITMLTGKPQKGIFGADYLLLRTSVGVYSKDKIDGNRYDLYVRNINNDNITELNNAGTPKKAVYEFKEGKFYINGAYKADIYNKAFTSTRSIYLSHVNDDGLSPAALIIHSFSIKNKEGDFERMMIPVRIKETGELGMFDVIAKNFHGKEGTGDFIAGPEVMLSKKYNSAKSGWGICLKVSGYNGASTLTGVPVLVRISENIPGFSYSKTLDGGLDIFFATDEKGENRLAHDIDTWNKEGTSLVWVKLPKLSGKETKFYMFYGSKEVATCPASTEVWSSYITVLHMNSYGENGVVDESGHGNNAVLINAEPDTLVASIGKFGSTTLRTVPPTTDVLENAPHFSIPNYNKHLTKKEDLPISTNITDSVDCFPETLTAMIFWKSNWGAKENEKWYGLIYKLSEATKENDIAFGVNAYGSLFGWYLPFRADPDWGGWLGCRIYMANRTEYASSRNDYGGIWNGDRLKDCWNYNVLTSDGEQTSYYTIFGESGNRKEVSKTHGGSSGIGKSVSNVALSAGEYDEVRITREAFPVDRVNADYQMMKNSEFVVSEGTSFRVAKGFSITIR